MKAKIRRDKNGRNEIPFTQRPEWAPKGQDEIPVKNKIKEATKWLIFQT